MSIGFVNDKGKVVIPCRSAYRSVTDFQEGFAIVEKVKSDFAGLRPRSVYNYLSKDGVELLGTDVFEVHPFSGGVANIKIYPGTKQYTVNKKGLLRVSKEGEESWASIQETSTLHE